jgi:insertion element IS1 protein InsB
VDFSIGSRTLKTVKRIIDTVLMAGAVKVYTDKLNLYGSLLPQCIHSTKQYSINHLERKHLSMRTHLKRLARRTICFSRSRAMLEACVRIYFWGQQKGFTAAQRYTVKVSDTTMVPTDAAVWVKNMKN